MMSGDLNEAIRLVKHHWHHLEPGVDADALAAVLDAIEGGEWERRTPFSDEAPIYRFCGPWRME